LAFFVSPDISSMVRKSEAEFTNVIPIDTNPPTYKYFAELKFGFSMDLFDTKFDQSAENDSIALMEELKEALNNQRQNDSGIPIEKLVEVSTLVEPVTFDAEYGHLDKIAQVC